MLSSHPVILTDDVIGDEPEAPTEQNKFPLKIS